jgi:hypothetical protein
MGTFQGFRWNHYALSLAMLVAVVFTLAVLQYRWIDQVSEAQDARAASRVRRWEKWSSSYRYNSVR